MTLPNQPSSVDAVLANQDFFRIFQPVTSPGDIWEIDNGAHAVYIGPNSDLAKVRLAYYQRAAALNQQEIADVSVNGPFATRIDALNVTPYQGLGGQKGRILAYPDDIVDLAYERPTSALSVPQRRYNVAPRIDLITALKQIPDIPQVRADRTLRFPRVPFQNLGETDTNGSTDIVIPIYGRRMVTVQIVTPALVAHETSFFLAALQPGTTQPFAKFLGSVLKPAIAVQDTDSVVYRASDQVSQITGTGTTDAPSTFDYTQESQPLPSAKGQADLLIINVRPAYGETPPPGYSMISLFIQVSDREA